MALLISALYCGYDKISELDRFLKEREGRFGGEYTCKNDRAYLKRLEELIKNADYPISFHGPLVDAEPASLKGSREYDEFVAAYDKTFELAKKYGARHIVYHTSYKPYKKEDIPKAFDICFENTAFVADMAKKAGVRLVIENLPIPPGGLSLIDNEAFFAMFKSLESDILIDTGHANISGLDLKRFAAGYAGRIKACHFHNNEGKADTHNSIFEGSFDFRGFKEIYKKYMPGADIVLEYKPGCGLSFLDIESHGEYVIKEFIDR